MAATCSPTSLQLRLAMNCYNRRVSPPTRTRPWMRNMEVGSGSLFLPQNERRFNGDSWIVSSSAADNFAGWSDSDHDSDQSIENQRKKWLGGTVGAGVAGVILFAGLTFAALSLSKWSTSRPKQQIEPFTTQQEVSLASDKEDDKVEESKSEASNDSDLESKTDNVDYATSASGTGNNDSFQEDLQYETSFDDKSVGPEMTPSSEILPSSEIDASFPVSTFEVDNTPVKVEPSNVPDITNLNTDHKTELVVSKINENSDPSLNSYTSTVREPNEPVGVNISDSSPMNTSSEPQIVPEDDTEAVASFLTKENLNLSNATQNSADRNSSALEVNYLDESDFSGTVSEFANNEMKESKQFFELPTPEISFSSAGIPAPSAVSAALQVLPGKVLVPAVVDQLQGQTFAALQVLKVIEADDQPSDLCTRREYARWLVAASSALSRSTVSKVYPAMYIENVTELAFDDIKPDDPDFFIHSRLS
ncbi:hypothetical protein OIU76_022703 [Salix suchowensis]|nr:hypothetical protein OIU76_022703 [Salix suchowensis]